MTNLDREADMLRRWFAKPRFKGLKRVYAAREVAEQSGTIRPDYAVARRAADGFHARLRELFEKRQCITTYGPYSPGQAVAMKRAGIEGIYLGGWATSAKGSALEDPGPDLASYPLSQVPDEAAPIVRALLTADRNQFHARSRMTEAQRKATPAVDYRPFIIADADTGHGGDAQVRNLVRRFVEIGVPGYHIEDQKPGVKKCGHQGGKVLVTSDEQIKRLSAARFQLDIMRVPGLIVARTDAEAATLLDGRGDERDQPFLLGATRTEVPTYRAAFLALLRRFHRLGLEELSGHELYAMCEEEYAAAETWLEASGVAALVREATDERKRSGKSVDDTLDKAYGRFVDLWQEAAGVKTYAEAVASAIEFRLSEGRSVDMTSGEWLEWAKTQGFYAARRRAASLGVDVAWDCEHAKTPDGYYQVRGGIEYAVAKSLAAAPYADLLWMETKTADLHEAAVFAKAIHAKFPDKLLAYNLSPSFNWDTTGLSDEEMRAFPRELAKLGYVFNFITYGGHQVDGMASEEFSRALREDGMLALAKLQRKLRLLDSPYRTPQTLVGGPRLDSALMSISGRTATTKAMGQGSTQHQHLIQTEVPPKLLEEWLELWRKVNHYKGKLKVALRPYESGSDLLELAILTGNGEKAANIVFADIMDRRKRKLLSVRDQNTFDASLRQRRLMTVAHVFLIHRYKAACVHYLTPTEDNQRQTAGMKALGIYTHVNNEVGEIIVADVNKAKIEELLGPDRAALEALITKTPASGSREKRKAAA